MQTQTDIIVEVRAYYIDIEGLRFQPQYGTDRIGEFHRLTAKADVVGGVIGSVWVTASGHYVKKDGTTGAQDARIRFGSLSTLPEEWQTRITTDLAALAVRVTVDHEQEPAGV